MFHQMVGVSVCHHVRVGIRSRKAASLELCGLLQGRVAGIRTTLLVEQEEGFIFLQPQDKQGFSPQVSQKWNWRCSATVITPLEA